MSTFSGKITEIPDISVDQFTGENDKSQVFFLSHCHQDHMKGLSVAFAKLLSNSGRYLYLSPVSAAILKRIIPEIENCLVEMDINSPRTIKLNENFITVTPIPAGHCPGSVMFLFETSLVTILYTGDYRISCKDIRKLKPFYDTFGHIKAVDKIYLDTTFFLKSYKTFPSRKESLDSICTIIQNWIDKSKNHVIKLHTPAKYGYESLLIEIYQGLNLPTHVSEEIYDFYSRIPQMDNAVTLTAAKTPIHLSCGSHYSLICRETIPFRVKTIKISAFRWRNDDLIDGISNDMEDRSFVCYSTHASYEEGVELIKFLKPKQIEPNVLHSGDSTNAEIYQNIEQLLIEDVPSIKTRQFFVKRGSSRHDDAEETKSVQFNRSSALLDSP